MSPMVRAPFTIEYALLGFLRPRPMYGYELHHLLSQPTGLGMIWQIKQSQLYALLDKLESDGLVTATIEAQITNRPSRKFYSLTKSGEDAYYSWIRQPVLHPRSIRQEFFAKFYFARQEDVELTHNLILSQLQVCQAWFEELEKQGRGESDESSFDGWVIKYRQQQVRGIQNWLLELESAFRSEVD